MSCGLTGIGDLIVTCASMHSRNRRAGILIGKGYKMDDAMKEVNMVVEGVYSAKAALELGKKYNIQMPIIEKVNEILFDGLGGFFYRFDLARGGVEREECVGRRLAYFHRFTN